MSGPEAPYEGLSRRVWLIAGLVALVVIGVTAGLAFWTAPTRASVETYLELLNAANTQNIPAASRLCSTRFLAAHPLLPAKEGGLIGLPRNINKNFQVWRSGRDVWLCPTNRVGPVYRFINESGAWKYDGPAGLLRPRGEFVRYEDARDDPTFDETMDALD
ncbi:MAG: hypothetical protein KGM43_08135 [Planctomycetota bacterium]|nr:hypothetical protein [Planctomycetota bacterium]